MRRIVDHGRHRRYNFCFLSQDRKCALYVIMFMPNDGRATMKQLLAFFPYTKDKAFET